MRYWEADDPTETEWDVSFRLYGWIYFRFETWEIEWPNGAINKFWGFKLYNIRIMFQVIS